MTLHGSRTCESVLSAAVFMAEYVLEEQQYLNIITRQVGVSGLYPASQCV